ncbi:MAG: hypothetical protein QM654_03980 [Dysgonamonadaceae bacterium]
MRTQESKQSLIASLRYQLERYKSVRNGFMCQQVSNQLRDLMASTK